MSPQPRPLDKIYAALDEIKERLTRVETIIDHQVKCPDPGSCMRLEKQLESSLSDLEQRTSALELSESKHLGERTMIGVFCTAIGVAIGWVIEFVKK